MPYGRSRNAFEWTLQLENAQVSGAASSGGGWFGLGAPVILDRKCRLSFTLNMKTHELCFCFKDFSRATSWWFFMTTLMITHPDPSWDTRFPTSEAQLLGIPKKHSEGHCNETFIYDGLQLGTSCLKPSIRVYVKRSDFFPRPLHQWHSITIYYSRVFRFSVTCSAISLPMYPNVLKER